MSTAIVWLRRDLRLADNAALAAACAAHERVLPVFIHAPGEEGDWPPGAASCWWLDRSLAALDRDLAAQGGRLHLARGDSLAALRDCVARSGAQAVYWNRRYEPASIDCDRAIKSALRGDGLQVHSSSGNLWHEPWALSTAQQQPYRVFTPYWRKLRSMIAPQVPQAAAKARHWLRLDGSLERAALALAPRIAWDAGLAQAWQPGEAGARDMLDLFCDDALADYARGRDLPSRHGTSRLSPHLHFGEITPRQIHHRLDELARKRPALQPQIEALLRELGWREFANHLLFHFPHTPTQPFNPRFEDFPWAPRDAHAIACWQRGRTGIPLVDAGMRELWHSGWMHNRVRMIVASLLTKNLRQHWHVGARWFWDTLVDADLANNTLGWQWVAGCGADAAPYFRVFNPVTQARKFDPQGEYLRRWLPELRDASPDLLHEPWRDATLLARSAYPAPIIDPGTSRKAALAAWQGMRDA